MEQHRSSVSGNAHKLIRPHRKRITLACNGCRVKRTKCDGLPDQCSACKYRGEECEYTNEESKRKRPGKAYILALEARITSLEATLASVSSGDACVPSVQEANACSSRMPHNSPGLDAFLTADGDGVSPNGDVSQSNQRSRGISEEIDELVDALGCFTVGDAGELRYFGASSNFSIIQNHSLRVASSVDARSRGIAAAEQMPGYYVPSDELRDHLLELYWRWQNSWQYIVARESFVMDLYVHKTGRHCNPLLLNAILAFASRYSSREELRTDPEDPNTAGDRFATQARVMLHHEYEAPTTSTVQATALLGLYWACVDREGLGFMYIGMASRMAMNLGLHLDTSGYAARGIISEEDAEVRKITFWGIYVLDKLYCLGMGRPAGINEIHLTTSKPKVQDRALIGLPEWARNISDPWPTSHITENYMGMCEILLITSEVIDQVYAQNATWTDQQRDERIMETHVRLVKWYEKLPKRLKLYDSSLRPAPPYVYQLHLQYHTSIVLLHRTYFHVLYRRGTGSYDPYGKDFHSWSCYDSASRISEICRLYRENYTDRCQAISVVHPVLTAAIIHCLHIKMSDVSDSRQAKRRLGLCFKTLYGINQNWDWANRSIRAIHSLAAQWGIDVWSFLPPEELSEESRRQYARYEESCGPLNPLFIDTDSGANASVPEFPNELTDGWFYGQPLADGGLGFLATDMGFVSWEEAQ